MVGNGVSRSTVSAEERGAREEEGTDMRDLAVSENREEKRACVGVLTHVQAGRGKRRKGKGEKRKASRKGKFSFLFLI